MDVWVSVCICACFVCVHVSFRVFNCGQICNRWDQPYSRRRLNEKGDSISKIVLPKPSPNRNTTKQYDNGKLQNKTFRMFRMMVRMWIANGGGEYKSISFTFVFIFVLINTKHRAMGAESLSNSVKTHFGYDFYVLRPFSIVLINGTSFAI